MGGKGDKFEWQFAYNKANEVVARLKGATNVTICGSIRRKKKKVGDIDLVVITDDMNALVDSVHSMADEILVTGQRNIRFIKDGIQVDIMIVEPHEYSGAILHLTGSKYFNIRCRAKAKSKGLKLNEYGLWSLVTGDLVESDEIGILKKIEMDKKYFDPANR